MTAAKSADVRWLLKDALGVVFKRKRLILGLFLIVALGISLAVLSIPTSYEVAGKLVVTRSRGDLLVTPADQRSFNFALTAPTQQDMAVHAELLKNRSLIEAVVKKLGLDKKREDSQAKAAENPITAGLNQISVWIPWTSSSPTGAQKAGARAEPVELRRRLDRGRPHDPGRAELEPARGAVPQQ